MLSTAALACPAHSDSMCGTCKPPAVNLDHMRAVAIEVFHCRGACSTHYDNSRHLRAMHYH